MPSRRRAAAPVVEDEIEDLEEITDDEDIEDLEEVADDDIEELEDEPEPPKPTKRATKAATKAAPVKAAKAASAPAESSEYDSNWLASYVSEETGTTHDGRSIRMMLRKLAKDGQLAREIGTDRGRYTFPKGMNDPTVKAVVRMVKSGEAAAMKRESLEAVKATRTAKAAAAPVKAAPAKATKATATKSTAAKAATTTRRRPAAK